MTTDDMQQTLLRKETLLTAILDNVLDGIITINGLGEIESFNKAAENIFGYTSAEVVGHNVRMLMPEPYHSQHDSHIQNYVSTGKRTIIGIEREVFGQRKDGSPFPVNLAVSEMKLDEKRMFIGIVHDLSERAKIERMKTEFVSTVSHELRTPLTSIRGSLSLLIGGVAGELPPQVRSLIDIAHKNSERLILLINDILDMEKIETGTMEFQSSPIKLMPLLKQVLEENQAYAEQYKVCYELEGDLPEVMVNVDASRLMQVLTNLLSNAAKFSPSGDKVMLAVTSNGQHVRIAVKDHGSGIPEQFHDQIFQKFSQADSSDTRKKGGTGLGLSITKAMVEKMGGSIGFESEPNVLTTFFVELPIRQAVPAPSCVESAAPIDALPGKRVLICEDDRLVAEALSLTLGQAGLATDIAYNATQAKGMLFQNDYAAMTLDLGLPDQHGIALIRELRTIKKTATLPILVVSANAIEGHNELSGEAFHVVDWISKPINRDQLLTALKQALKQVSTTRPKVLHVEDDPYNYQVVTALAGEIADVENAPNLAEARRMLQDNQYNLVILDILLPDGSGMALLPLLNAATPPIPVMVFSSCEMEQEDIQKVQSVLVKSRTNNAQILATIKRLIGVE